MTVSTRMAVRRATVQRLLCSDRSQLDDDCRRSVATTQQSLLVGAGTKNVRCNCLGGSRGSAGGGHTDLRFRRKNLMTKQCYQRLGSSPDVMLPCVYRGPMSHFQMSSSPARRGNSGLDGSAKLVCSAHLHEPLAQKHGPQFPQRIVRDGHP